MEPVLIYKDEERIASESSYLEKIVSYLGELYISLDVVGITVTLTDLINLGTMPKNHQIGFIENKVKAFATEYLLQKAGEPDFNGVKISKDKLKEMLEIPDLTGVCSIISNHLRWREEGKGMDARLMQLVDGEVLKTNNAEELLEETYTYYSKNDFGAVLTTKLFEMCSMLNLMNDFYTETGITADNSNVRPISGIEFHNELYRPVLHYIRKLEGFRSDYVAV